MLLYYLFWMFMGFNLHFYIILGTNLLTGGPTRIVVYFCLFQCFEEKEYQTESKRNETFGSVIFGTNVIQETWIWSQGSFKVATRQGDVPPPSWAPHGSTDLLLSPIYTHIPRKHPGSRRNTVSDTITFCIREIPSWRLCQCSARGGIDHGGPLHHHQGLSYELWVVFHRPSGP